MATANDVLKLINGSLEEKLTIIISNTEKQLLNMLYAATINNSDVETIYTIPDNLDYIVTEVSLIRLGRIGSEGISSESVGGNNVHYMLPSTDFDSYKVVIKNYVDVVNNFSSEGSTTFL